ncbi:jg4418, partial [Pararge aegeria aegeria]
QHFAGNAKGNAKRLPVSINLSLMCLSLHRQHLSDRDTTMLLADENKHGTSPPDSGTKSLTT